MTVSNTLYSGILAALVMVVTPVVANAVPWAHNSINIRGDRGGQIIKYALRVKKAERSGKKVRFRGSCSSACTLYLSLPRSQTCISRGAKFRFHLPYGSNARGNRVAANYMRRSYPGWVRGWIRSNGGLSHRMKTMDYAYASKFIPSCETRTAKTRRVKGRSKAFGFSAKNRFKHFHRFDFK